MGFSRTRQNQGTKNRQPFGHRAVIRVKRTERRGEPPTHRDVTVIREMEIHRRGSRAVIERAARLTKGFDRVLEIEPLTIREYIRAYGNGTEHGRNRVRTICDD